MTSVHLPFSFGRYCLADDRLLEAVNFLDLGNGAGWELLQVQYSISSLVEANFYFFIFYIQFP